MSLRDFLSKQFIDVIEWVEPQTASWRTDIPCRIARFRMAASSRCAIRRWPCS